MAETATFENQHLVPDCICTLASDGEDVRIKPVFTKVPDVRKHASKSSLYLLAIQQLHANGVLDTIVDSLLARGPITEVDAVNRINSHHE